MLRPIRHAALLACGALLAACYSYSPVPVETAPLGAVVRARVTQNAASQFAEQLGREARVFEGELLELQPDGILLAVTSTLGDNGHSPIRAHQRVAIARSDLLELEIRRLDRLKTSGVVALAAGVAAYVAIKAFASGGDPTGEGKGGPNQNVIP